MALSKLLSNRVARTLSTMSIRLPYKPLNGIPAWLPPRRVLIGRASEQLPNLRRVDTRFDEGPNSASTLGTPASDRLLEPNQRRPASPHGSDLRFDAGTPRPRLGIPHSPASWDRPRAYSPAAYPMPLLASAKPRTPLVEPITSRTPRPQTLPAATLPGFKHGPPVKEMPALASLARMRPTAQPMNPSSYPSVFGTVHLTSTRDAMTRSSDPGAPPVSSPHRRFPPTSGSEGAEWIPKATDRSGIVGAKHDLANSPPQETYGLPGSAEDQPAQTEIHLDGQVLGLWITDYLHRALTRPPITTNYVNSEANPTWPGQAIFV